MLRHELQGFETLGFWNSEVLLSSQPLNSTWEAVGFVSESKKVEEIGVNTHVFDIIKTLRERKRLVCSGGCTW